MLGEGGADWRPKPGASSPCEYTPDRSQRLPETDHDARADRREDGPGATANRPGEPRELNNMQALPPRPPRSASPKSRQVRQQGSASRASRRGTLDCKSQRVEVHCRAMSTLGGPSGRFPGESPRRPGSRPSRASSAPRPDLGFFVSKSHSSSQREQENSPRSRRVARPVRRRGEPPGRDPRPRASGRGRGRSRRRSRGPSPAKGGGGGPGVRDRRPVPFPGQPQRGGIFFTRRGSPSSADRGRQVAADGEGPRGAPPETGRIVTARGALAYAVLSRIDSSTGDSRQGPQIVAQDIAEHERDEPAGVM